MIATLRRWAVCAGVALGASLLPTAAFGWSEETHQTTGAIAEADLARRDPAALAALVALARSHQDYPVFERAAAKLDEPTRRRALFEWLARWPDDIRKGPDDHPKWHYLLRVVHGRTWQWPLRNGEANAGFAYNYDVLANPCARPADRAKAIGWLIHIVGDIQQPLHGGHQMTASFPLTDRAGELAFVRRTAGGEPTNLHQYWDKMMERGGVHLPSGQPDWATAIAAAWPRDRISGLERITYPAARFDSWMIETGELARLAAYQGTFLHASADPGAAPTVTARENALALRLAKRRIATSGYRIADTLAAAVNSARANRANCPV